MSRLREIVNMRAMRALFDREFYLRSNPDVAAAGVDPLRHYVKYGSAEQRQPHPLFDPAHYLACCPEARDAEYPLLHFLQNRSGKWTPTHPLFDCEYYSATLSGGNPLVSYLAQNQHAGVEGSQFGQC